MWIWCLKLSSAALYRTLRWGKAMFGFPIQTKRFDKGDAFAMTSSNNPVVPSAREALNKFKMEAANEVGVNLKQGYNGDLTSKQAGSVGGQMVKK